MKVERKKPMRKAVAALVFISVLTLTGGAMNVDTVPNPLAAAGSWVGDNGGVLGPEYIALIHAACESLKVKTAAEFAVITIDDLGGLPIEDFAARLFKRFGVGEAGKENGLLLLFSRDDRQVRFEVGYGLEGMIPDALASRILDEQALPFFREGQYGRGIFATVKKAAETIAAASGVELGLSDPAAWPAQIVPPQPVAAQSTPPEPQKKEKSDPLPAALISGGAVALLSLLGNRRIARRVAKEKGRAAKERAARGAGVIGLTWLGSAAGLTTLAATTGSVLPFLVSLGLVPAAATFGQVRSLRALRRRIAGYQEPCGKCGQPMLLLDEQADDAFLSAEELAEEQAGGMNYEVWQCENCGASTSFALKLAKAAECPKCKRRTLITTTSTLVAATRTSGGKVKIETDCRNPNCDYLKVVQRNTPRLPPPSSGTSGSSSRGSFHSSGSSRSSFGGGRSGGGGASKGW